VNARPIGSVAAPTVCPATAESDLLIHALARYIEALHRRYPDGPAQMRREDLDGRANITAMHPPKKDSAA
jgi:hypothetical protein